MTQRKNNPGAGGRPGHQNLHTVFDGTLPHYDDYEKNILGCILEDEKLIGQVQLRPEDFYSTRHQIILSTMLEMQEKDIPIDELSLYEELKKRGLLDDIGGLTYLGCLKDIAISPANIKYHVEKVKEASLNRNLWEKSVRLKQAIENETDRQTIAELGTEIEKLSRPEKSTSNIISLVDYKPKAMAWLLENAIPDKFPTTVYGDGGLGKSYLGLYFATVAALGKENFLGLKFPEESLNVLYFDWELDVDEFSRRALRIAKGLELSRIPANLSYYSPTKSLYKLLPELKGIISSKGVQFLIIDSLGAACVDPEDVGDIVEVFSQIKNLGIATLILDHQSKMQSQDNYNTKTPYGSVYKYNLSRSVFQLSCIGREKNQISLVLRHKKSNFGRLLDDLIFDVSFEEDRVMFLESKALSQDQKDIMFIHEGMVELEVKGEKINQKNLILQLKGILGRDRIVALLDKGEGKYWDKRPGDKKEILYNPKTLKSGYIYNTGFRVLENEGCDEIPEVIV